MNEEELMKESSGLDKGTERASDAPCHAMPRHATPRRGPPRAPSRDDQLVFLYYSEGLHGFFHPL